MTAALSPWTEDSRTKDPQAKNQGPRFLIPRTEDPQTEDPQTEYPRIKDPRIEDPVHGLEFCPQFEIAKIFLSMTLRRLREGEDSSTWGFNFRFQGSKACTPVKEMQQGNKKVHIFVRDEHKIFPD